MDRLLTMTEVAEMLGVPIATLRWWRNQGTAPRAIKLNGHVRFREGDVHAWLDAQLEPAAGE